MAIVCHMFRVFFTGAFRKPRELNWVLGTVMALLAIIEGFAGYSLPDDLLSGTGIRAMAGFVQTSPVIGSYLVSAIFGGPFPGEMIIPRLYSAHVLLIPAILIAIFTVHIGLVFLQKHTQFPGPGRTNENVVGFPVMPVYAAKAGGFFFIVFGVLALISALVQINPIWAYGPYDPSPVTAGSQPDWYMGFADGALRLLPGFLEFTVFGFTVSMNIFPGALLLLPLVYILLGIYPFVEHWVTGDTREHHLLDRPRNMPVRTAIGMAAITAYSILLFASGNDIMAIKLGMSINDLTWFFRIGFFVLPPIVFWVTKRICLSLQRRDRDTILHGRETGTVIRTPDGRFFERHDTELTPEHWILVQHEAFTPLQPPGPVVDANGVAATRRPQGTPPGEAVTVLLRGCREPRDPGRARCGPPPRAGARGDRAVGLRRRGRHRGRREHRGDRRSPLTAPAARRARVPRTPRGCAAHGVGGGVVERVGSLTRRRGGGRASRGRPRRRRPRRAPWSGSAPPRRASPPVDARRRRPPPQCARPRSRHRRRHGR